MDNTHHEQRGCSHQDDDVFLSLGVQVVSKLRQLTELHFVICEILLILHVVDVGVLDILQEENNCSL